MKKVLKWILGILVGVVCVAFLFIGFLTVTEYKPEDQESLVIEQNSSSRVSLGGTMSILSWNIGFGALGDNADFFMDGGTHSITASKERVEENMEKILNEIEKEDTDFLFLQEIDLSSKRSYGLNEYEMVAQRGKDYGHTFAYNYKCFYVPFPWSPLGKIESGISTWSKYEMVEATRYQLPIPFSWPIRVANLKRGVALHRLPIEDSEKELVLINLHLEAYDDGEGKVQQTLMLKEIMEEEVKKGNYVIAGGDFNQIFSSVTAPKQISSSLWQAGEIEESMFSHGWQFLMDEGVPSCRSLDQPYKGAEKETFQFYIIDGFIVSSNIEVLDFGVIDLNFESSDHNPIEMTLQLKE